LAAEIGGYVGLLLGVSFFHLANILASVVSKKKLEENVDDSNVKDNVTQIDVLGITDDMKGADFKNGNSNFPAEIQI
jgi:hypothetical protein